MRKMIKSRITLFQRKERRAIRRNKSKRKMKVKMMKMMKKRK
jgi:hypothetical protein